MHTKNKKILVFYLFTIILCLSACDSGLTSKSTSDNLINKVNVIEDRWINYEGESENNKTMNQSQFIPVDPEKTYKLDTDAYVSYFYGDEYIETILHEDTPQTIETIEEADGIVLSFNKENLNGIKLVEINE